jgi:hypothetical protein
MRKHLIYALLLIGSLSCPVFAQKVEIFGGAQYEHLEPSYNAVGWNAALTGNFKHVLGITADVSGAYNSHRANSSVYTYTVGPVLTARLPVVQPFIHALFGGVTFSSGRVNDKRFCYVRWRRPGHRASKRHWSSPVASRLVNDSIQQPEPKSTMQNLCRPRTQILTIASPIPHGN